MARGLTAVAAFALAAFIQTCGAAEYTFSLPQVLGSPQGEQNLAVDLGGPFSSISSVRLRVAGHHTPGWLGDLNSPSIHAYPASIDAYSPAQPFGNSGILGELLPSVAGAFEVDEAFHRISPGGAPDYTSWLDGTANFYFSAGPSGYLAIYYTIAKPMVEISAASLIVTGERAGAVTFRAADFNADGTVAGDDLELWQSVYGTNVGPTLPGADADGDGDADGDDFLAWQRQLGHGAAPAGLASIPEPSTGALMALGLAAATMFARRRRP